MVAALGLQSPSDHTGAVSSNNPVTMCSPSSITHTVLTDLV